MFMLMHKTMIVLRYSNTVVKQIGIYSYIYFTFVY